MRRAITIEGAANDNAYVYRDDPGDIANLSILLGRTQVAVDDGYWYQPAPTTPATGLTR